MKSSSAVISMVKSSQVNDLQSLAAAADGETTMGEPSYKPGKSSVGELTQKFAHRQGKLDQSSSEVF